MNRFTYPFLLVCLFFSNTACAQVYSVKTVPNQKLIDGSYVSNPDEIIEQRAVNEINHLLKNLEDSTTAQIAVIAVHSIGDNDIFSFAEELFNDWKIGRNSTDNGLLILLVEDQKTIRFHTGDGLEAILPDALCKQIQREYMVPYFKEGNYSEGVLNGVRQTVQILYDPSASDVKAEEQEDVDGWTVLKYAFLLFGGIIMSIVFISRLLMKSFSDSKGQSAPATALKLTRMQWVLLYMLLPAAIVLSIDFLKPDEPVLYCLIALYGYVIFTFLIRQFRMKRVINRFVEERDYFSIVQFLKDTQWYWLMVGIFFPIPFLFYFFYHLHRKKLYRNHARNCSICQARMVKLDERADDAHLSEAQIFEEELKSVDYDVWQCTACQATEKWIYKNSWTKYEDCPKCGTVALYTKSTRTITSATYSSSGTGERTKECKFCHHIDVSTYTIAQLVESSSSSSSSFSSSGSSSGGSWGGGSSSGGGASSSW